MLCGAVLYGAVAFACLVRAVKALHRKGVALAALKSYADAREVFHAALVADPENKEVKKQLSLAARNQKKEKAEEKKMAQKMFG